MSKQDLAAENRQLKDHIAELNQRINRLYDEQEAYERVIDRYSKFIADCVDPLTLGEQSQEELLAIEEAREAAHEKHRQGIKDAILEKRGDLDARNEKILARFRELEVDRPNTTNKARHAQISKELALEGEPLTPEYIKKLIERLR